MKTTILLGPIKPNDEILEKDYGILMEFTPFQKNCVTETDARHITKNGAVDTWRFGHFAAPSPNQLLYLFNEDIINGAIITEIDEKTLYRISETIKKPLFLATNSDNEERLRQREQQPIYGLYFPKPPSSKTIKQRKKPYIFPFPEKIEEQEENMTALFQINPPFALCCKTRNEANQAKQWIKKITKETR